MRTALTHQSDSRRAIRHQPCCIEHFQVNCVQQRNTRSELKRERKFRIAFIVKEVKRPDERLSEGETNLKIKTIAFQTVLKIAKITRQATQMKCIQC